MGTIIGLLCGLGLLLIWSSMWATNRPRKPAVRPNFMQDLHAAGFTGISMRVFVFASILLGALAAATAYVVTSIPVVALLGAVVGASSLWLLAKSRAGQARKRRREQWPDVIEHLLSSIRAGMSLPDSLVTLGKRGPQDFRTDFLMFERDFHASGQFDESLNTMKNRLADPTADRVFEALRIARSVGGADLTSLLESLNQFLRQDIRTRGELEARQSWTVGGARVAVAAPWIVLALLGSRDEAANAYSSPIGVALLLGGAALSVIAYFLMLKLGALPTEERVLV